ncbi:MAG TPA: SDR family oxidoreductase [Clostridia bacterium]|nr:SDR family oxidoreductase [Clostridia bacterium]HOL61337.1 SDR family oxidoreductase [Clostridia bacterium]HPO54014.1 SDR family oxidoreductase [Clostridia bacterium]
MATSVNLTGKNVVITGAGGVICSGFAKALALAGARVALLDLNVQKAEEYAADIRAEGGFAKAFFANVLEKESLEACYNQVVAELGGVDILINGAGGNHPSATTAKETYEEGDIELKDVTTFFTLPADGIKKVFDINFTGILLTTQVFAKGMVGKGGTIINISSMNSYRPLTKIPAYSAAKAAVSNFTQWLAVHFAKAGIRVNAIAPGFFSTNQNKALLYTQSGELTPRSHKILDHTPMGRFGEIGDLIGTLYWLADDNFSGFVTGVVIPVDGGFSAYSGV